MSNRIMACKNKNERRSMLRQYKMNRPLVLQNNSYDKIRRGRGWSSKEVLAANVEKDTLKRFGLAFDRRRDSMHEMNVNSLKDLRFDLKTLSDKAHNVKKLNSYSTL